jgi:energy-coupling factor transporter transmembrane protein EcfT
MRVKIDIEKSKKTKPKRSSSGLTFPLLIEANRATTTAAMAIEIGTFQSTEPQLW